jgi:hypothetical protein
MPNYQTCPRIVLVDNAEFIHELMDMVLRRLLGIP